MKTNRSLLLVMTFTGLALSNTAIAGDSMNSHHDQMEGWKHHGHHDKSHHDSEHYGKGHWSPTDRLEKMKKHLKLSDSQVAQLKDIFERADLQLKPLREQGKENRKLIRAMIDGGSIDDTRLEQLAKAQGELKAQKIVIRSKSQVDTMKVLNADQLEKFKNYWNKKGHHRMH